MAPTDREAKRPVEGLLQALAEKPYAYGFFQAMRLLECLHPEAPRFGTSRRAADDPIRLGQEPATTFESATLTRFDPGEAGRPHRLTVRFLGLFGANGPLPLHLTTYARDRLRRHQDPTFIRFLDMFHHRMLSLFYRAWADHEPTVARDRPETDRFGNYVGSLAGLGMAALRNRDGMADAAKRHYIGRLAAQNKCPEGLEAMIGDHFRIPARIEEFVGAWMRLPPENRCRLGKDRAAGELNRSLVVGASVWGCQHKFRLHIGPLKLAEYVDLLPPGDRIRRMAAMVRNYIGDELTWDMTLILQKEQVPALRLNRGNRLGWTTWLNHRKNETDANDLTLNPLAREGWRRD